MALHTFRIIFYVLLFLFSLVEFGLCAARLHYTLRLPPGDPLHGGKSFHDPIVVELLVTSIITVFWAPTIANAVHSRYEHRKRYIFSFIFEVIGLGVLFVFWLVGAAISTQIWGNLKFCHQYKACRILTALVAFSWIGWGSILILLIMSVLFAISNNAFHEPLHGRWDPRESHYRDGEGAYPNMRMSRGSA